MKVRGAPPREMRRSKAAMDSNAEEAKPPKGRYVPIPARYADGSTSGLTYTVKRGAQTHDIELSDKPVPTPGPAGR